MFLFYGAFEPRLYISRRQNGRFKYNPVFPADKKTDVFWFKSQNVDNMICGFRTGVPIWTAYEAVVLWAFASAPVRGRGSGPQSA